MNATAGIMMMSSKEFEADVVDLWRTARLITCAPARLIDEQRKLLFEAREYLNDALSKVERHAA